MRFVSAALVLLASAVAFAADAPAKRFGVEANLDGFPQGTPQQALASVLKAIDLKRPDYIVAHLADPQFVDRRVKETSYEELLAEVTAKLVDDPGAAKQLKTFLKDGHWDIAEATASVTLKEGTDRAVSFRKADGRWFLEQPYRKPAKKGERE
jgi:hypothetical protein